MLDIQNECFDREQLENLIDFGLNLWIEIWIIVDFDSKSQGALFFDGRFELKRFQTPFVGFLDSWLSLSFDL